MQLNIDFNAVHVRENNPDSEAYLELRREDFNAQCWIALKRMLDGEKLTMLGCITTGISDIHRRAKDLIDKYGIPVKREWAELNGEQQKHKWYYIEDSDREAVMRRIIDWAQISRAA